MRQLRIFVWMMITVLCGHSSLTASSNAFSQLSLGFANKKSFRYDANAAENSLTIEIYNTSTGEISGLDTYDERHVRRILVKDMGGQGVAVKLVLKNRQIRATVSSFDEPFRIVVDLYQQDYQEPRDQVTGMPLALGEQPAVSEPAVNAPATNNAPAAVSTATNEDSGPSSKRLLMQSTPRDFEQPEQLIAAMEAAPEGTGALWKEFPVYIYRLQTAVFEKSKGNDDWLKRNAVKAIGSTEALADYAGQMFDYGHESRALVAYQTVLYKDPGVFEKNALHLWRLAESHLGQGNLTLADGYFQSLAEKFPGHDLVPFARMRRLDIQAIRSIQQNGPGGLAALASQVNALTPKKSQELIAQLAIRTAYWRDHDQATLDALKNNRMTLVALDDQSRINLQNSIGAVESERTAFLGSSLLLNNAVQDQANWSDDTGKLAADYFKRFSGPGAEPFRAELSDKVKSKLTKHFDKLLTAAAFAKVVEDFEALPISLKSIAKTPAVAWTLAEAYRNTNRSEPAVGMYETAAQGLTSDVERFKANFWLSVVAGQTMQGALAKTRGASTTAMRGKIRKADDGMMRAWTSMSADQKSETYATMRPHLVKSLEDKALTKTPATIILDRWTQTLATETALATPEATDVDTSVSAGASSVRLLKQLSDRFAALGMNKERLQATALMQYLKPATFGNDAEARKLWANQLSALANEYREANRFLEAGKMYALAGTESADWESRAESLYKGGLLLYRAGRKEEAIEAFRKAAEDANNQFYANLAKERLSQLEP